VPEFEDTAFGPRASAVHTRLQEKLLSSRNSTYVLSAIPRQMEVIAMLRHINSELKVCALNTSHIERLKSTQQCREEMAEAALMC